MILVVKHLFDKHLKHNEMLLILSVASVAFGSIREKIRVNIIDGNFVFLTIAPFLEDFCLLKSYRKIPWTLILLLTSFLAFLLLMNHCRNIKIGL